MEYIPFGGKDKLKLSASIVRSYLCRPTRSGAMPSDQDVMKFMMLCKHRGLNPFEGDAFLVGYDAKNGPEFSLITAHQAFLKRAEVHPEYDGMESGVIVKDGNGAIVDRDGDFYLEDDLVIGGWATVFFKNRSHPMRKRIHVKNRRKGTQIWDNDTAGMICKCAEADALRASFPTLLGGMYAEGEIGPAEDAEIASVKPAAPALPNGRVVVGRTKQIAQEPQPAPQDFEDHRQPEAVSASKPSKANGKNGHAKHAEPAVPDHGALVARLRELCGRLEIGENIITEPEDVQFLEELSDEKLSEQIKKLEIELESQGN